MPPISLVNGVATALPGDHGPFREQLGRCICSFLALDHEDRLCGVFDQLRCTIEDGRGRRGFPVPPQAAVLRAVDHGDSVFGRLALGVLVIEPEDGEGDLARLCPVDPRSIGLTHLPEPRIERRRHALRCRHLWRPVVRRHRQADCLRLSPLCLREGGKWVRGRCRSCRLSHAFRLPDRASRRGSWPPQVATGCAGKRRG